VSMKVLLLTPYSPLLHHDHAANDLAFPLVKALAPFMDLHVYAPGQRNGALTSWRADGVTYYAGSPVHPTRLDRLGSYPYAARGSWSRRSTNEAVAIVRNAQPDIVHAEYWQAAEPLLRSAQFARTSITLHDLPGAEAAQPRGDISLLRYWLQQLERAKTQRANDAIVNEIDALLVFSERDRGKIAGARGIVEIATVGLNTPAAGWLGDRPHVAAFGGAMWRPENEAAAIFLVREVMPLVRQGVPGAELRIFGARPSAAVCALDAEPGVTVVGEVADYEYEFRRAGVTLAPSMVEAGILMKAIRAMAMGCPVVLNSASADPIVGLTHGVHALVGDSSGELAARVVELMQDNVRARRLGQMAMGLVRAHFSWERTVEVYYGVFEQLLGV
jgi:glycosyltransferase involved in cell wall biosynthesis